MTLRRGTQPEDLRHQTTGAPRRRTAAWAVGDTMHVGATRWIIRSIIGENVELEASSAAAGIWWRTTIDRLPVKAAR